MESIASSASISASSSNLSLFFPRRSFSRRPPPSSPSPPPRAIARMITISTPKPRAPASRQFTTLASPSPPSPRVFVIGCGDGVGAERGDGRGWTTGSGWRALRSPPSRISPIAASPPSLVPLHQVPATPHARGVHVQRVRPTHHARHQPPRLHDGTVFVQCCGCNVFHKLVDNLNLFHGMNCYVNPSFLSKGDTPFTFPDSDDNDGDNIFPIL
uniref:DNL-type domain-containing protein n=1 Tax=Ananas comosus var. bracteatus TaxID=296719 RepID=A0A6V7PIE8_ANACO|nr:unnamed protein product [Ananas comosus var. bracteatus]